MQRPPTKSRRRTKKQTEEALQRRDERDTEAFVSRQIAQSRRYRAALARAMVAAGRSSDRLARALDEMGELVSAFSAPERQDFKTICGIFDGLFEDADALRAVGNHMPIQADELTSLERGYAFSDQNDKGVAAEQRELLRNLERLFQRAAHATHVQLGAEE